MEYKKEIGSLVVLVLVGMILTTSIRISEARASGMPLDMNGYGVMELSTEDETDSRLALQDDFSEKTPTPETTSSTSIEQLQSAACIFKDIIDDVKQIEKNANFVSLNSISEKSLLEDMNLEYLNDTFSTDFSSFVTQHKNWFGDSVFIYQNMYNHMHWWRKDGGLYTIIYNAFQDTIDKATNFIHTTKVVKSTVKKIHWNRYHDLDNVVDRQLELQIHVMAKFLPIDDAMRSILRQQIEESIKKQLHKDMLSDVLGYMKDAQSGIDIVRSKLSSTAKELQDFAEKVSEDDQDLENHMKQSKIMTEHINSIHDRVQQDIQGYYESLKNILKKHLGENETVSDEYLETAQRSAALKHDLESASTLKTYRTATYKTFLNIFKVSELQYDAGVLEKGYKPRSMWNIMEDDEISGFTCQQMQEYPELSDKLGELHKEIFEDKSRAMYSSLSGAQREVIILKLLCDFISKDSFELENASEKILGIIFEGKKNLMGTTNNGNELELQGITTNHNKTEIQEIFEKLKVSMSRKFILTSLNRTVNSHINIMGQVSEKIKPIPKRAKEAVELVQMTLDKFNVIEVYTEEQVIEIPDKLKFVDEFSLGMRNQWVDEYSKLPDFADSISDENMKRCSDWTERDSHLQTEKEIESSVENSTKFADRQGSDHDALGNQSHYEVVTGGPRYHIIEAQSSA